MIRKLSKYAFTSVAIIIITITVFSLFSTSTADLPNANPNVLNEAWLQQTLFNNSTEIVMIQVAPTPNPQVSVSQTPLPCHGPHITATIDKTALYINQTLTITGQISPPEPNATVRVCYVRPDFSWIDQYILTDPQTGKFNTTQELDMIGYWNIFPIHGHITDRFHAEVTDPTGVSEEPTDFINPWRTSIPLVVTSIALACIGGIVALTGLKKKTRKISSLRVFIQILLVFLLFTGMFVDHQNLPRPVRQIAVHDFLVGTDVFGVALPEGFPVPFFACYYPCGRTVSCALWELQVYIYPFLDASHGWGVDYNTSGVVRLAIVIGTIILASLILGRVWCGWVCPFGLYLDALTYLRKRLKIKRYDFSNKFNDRFHQLSYVILAAILILCVLFASYAITGTQLIPGTEQGGFIYTYYSAPFCTVCPMKPVCLLMQNQAGILQSQWIFNGAGEFYQLGMYLTSVNLIILAIVTVAAFFIRRSWCRICPLGGLIALFNRFPPFKWISAVRLEKSKEKCTKCGICKRVCPTQVKEIYEQTEGDVMTSQCIGCLRCVEMCPYEDALKFKFAGKTVCRSRNWLDNNKPSAGNADKGAQLPGV
ncbi:MAG: 4Fe-4S binding protein [Nitrososphaerota archaeon]|jgi:polyferredoxin|uniref:4Fe-4S binding protein n=1 Tax=Candidatus Bathycorpusculum sp. TaxID=2994959 RepID=UPI002834EE75|nr:4Fe-4S binding protein [Candidatus Termitimicrobium sp.]MDR0493492.1 4Fe-4S binding protein [Nitrososphaerota archaeon]